MPILIKDFNWSQTEDEIIIRVPLKGVITSKVDFFIRENFVKISYPPFYFEVFLSHNIDEKESRCKILEVETKIILKKIEIIKWEKLEKDFEKNETVKMKEEIIKNAQISSEIERKEKLILKDEIKKEEIRKEIGRETVIREGIESVHKTACLNEMAGVSNQFKKPDIKNNQKDTPRPKIISAKKPADNSTKKSLFQDIPEVRKTGNITITFSERNFVTPKRESQEPAEIDWLMKQHEARKVVGFVEEDLRPEERNPNWLKTKGNDFYRNNNFLAAISAYSLAIRLTNSKCYDLFLNRSAAHFAQENYQRCAEDCSKAFDLLKPEVESTLKFRVQCLARRGKFFFCKKMFCLTKFHFVSKGAALCKLGLTKQGYDELIAAIKLDPNDKQLKQDAEMIRSKLENPDSD